MIAKMPQVHGAPGTLVEIDFEGVEVIIGSFGDCSHSYLNRNFLNKTFCFRNIKKNWPF